VSSSRGEGSVAGTTKTAPIASRWREDFDLDNMWSRVRNFLDDLNDTGDKKD
jgi:hypothetical protein